jgi:hypothetical protein
MPDRLASIQALWSVQSADRARDRYDRLVAPCHDHISSRIEDAQFGSLFLRKEPGKMHCRPRFVLVENHRFGQLTAAELKSLRDGPKFERVHFCS